MRTHQTTLLSLIVLTICGCSTNSRPSDPRGLGRSLGSLVQPMDGKAMHEGSWDRSGGNADARRVDPGQTITLFDHQGAGIVRRFWVTIAPRAEESIHRQAILRMYWDDESTPSVEVPIGDFFGVGFGKQVDYVSLPLNETSGGYNCYWPMPFHKRARWTLTNLSGRRIDAFYYNIDYTAYDSLPPQTRHFHAQWRRENPTTPGRNYTILEATGEGQFVGAALFMQPRRGHSLGFLEGDEMIYFDGEARPSIIGTGTEDYFSSGWYFDRGTYSAPYHGVVIKDESLGRISAYRWHIQDAMPFKKSIKVTIEHGHDNSQDGDYSSVAFWYQSEPHAAFPTLPAAKDLLAGEPLPPLKIAGAIEGESLVNSAHASRGAIERQDMTAFGTGWSGDAQLFWQPDSPGVDLHVPIPAPSEGKYKLTGYFTKAPDYATVEIRLADQVLTPGLDLWADVVRTSGAVDLGDVELKQGDNPLVISVTGKSDRSTGCFVGVDAFVLSRR